MPRKCNESHPPLKNTTNPTLNAVAHLSFKEQPIVHSARQKTSNSHQSRNLHRFYCPNLKIRETNPFAQMVRGVRPRAPRGKGADEGVCRPLEPTRLPRRPARSGTPRNDARTPPHKNTTNPSQNAPAHLSIKEQPMVRQVVASDLVWGGFQQLPPPTRSLLTTIPKKLNCPA